jgi:hypothetical protein
MSESTRSRLLLALLMSFVVASSAIAAAAVKQWEASAIPVDTIFEGDEKAGLPFEEPGRFMIDSKGNVLILDKKLGSVFKLDKKGKLVWRVQGTPKRFKGLQDIYVDGKDQVWVLDFLSDAICTFSSDGKFLQSFKVARYPRKLAVTSTGEVVTNPGTGRHLLDVYSPTGTYLRSFGARFPYPNDTSSDFELNSGQMAAGRNGEIYFSFSYPPVIRSYGGKGQLLWETKIPFDKPISKPQMTVRQIGDGRIGSSFQYHVATLDLSLDRAGRILCLTAGTPVAIAFTKGSQRLDAFSPDGRHLGAVTLPVSASRMAMHPSGLFLLENQKVKVLTRFAFQTTG